MFENSSAIVRNVHSQVADRIGMSIVRGDILAGEALPSEMQICELIAVSRTVVREAIRTLTGKGLVEARAKSGTRVRPPEQCESTSIRTCCAGSSKPPTSTATSTSCSSCVVRSSLRQPAGAGRDPARGKRISPASAPAATAWIRQQPTRTSSSPISPFIRGIVILPPATNFFWPIAQMSGNHLAPELFTIAAKASTGARALL